MRIQIGDARDVLTTLPDQSVQTCVTSPPYFGLRNYEVDGQIGLESTVDEYVSNLVDVFREVRRVLKDDGTLWLNLGDSYATGGSSEPSAKSTMNGTRPLNGIVVSRKKPRSLRPKDLIGIPWKVAFALQADGWILRQDIIWSKPNPMPESVKDRCTKSHEYIFLLSKGPRYYYDAAAIAEDGGVPKPAGPKNDASRNDSDRVQIIRGNGETRNKRSVWNVATQGFSEAHFATFPPKLVEPCILAGSREGDTVLDPFGGAGTTGLVADRLGRDSILIELNPEYAEIARRRITGDAPLFASVEVS